MLSVMLSNHSTKCKGNMKWDKLLQLFKSTKSSITRLESVTLNMWCQSRFRVNRAWPTKICMTVTIRESMISRGWMQILQTNIVKSRLQTRMKETITGTSSTMFDVIARQSNWSARLKIRSEREEEILRWTIPKMKIARHEVAEWWIHQWDL